MASAPSSFNHQQARETDDLTTLPFLDETSLNALLHERFVQGFIYTWVGGILVAINPYEDLRLYTEAQRKLYRNSLRSELPPHIFAVADFAYTSAIQTGKDQVCIISGESGAGKTESTKLIISHVLSMQPSPFNSDLNQKILKMNPLLEAFGNAQTTMNFNSSRFGKFIELKFFEGTVIGAVVTEYLLEKSRVAIQSQGERNFHVFYSLLRGLDHTSRENFFISNQPFNYLRGQTVEHLDGHILKWVDIKESLEFVGFDAQEVHDVAAILCGVLHVGNISFSLKADLEGSEWADCSGNEALYFACSLLKLDQELCQAALTLSESTVRGERIERRFSLFQACSARDAMAKALYAKLFTWLVYKINKLLCSSDTHAKTTSIAILDIFGFENFAINSFEQLCINLANEFLQGHFNDHVFKMEQEEYRREGVLIDNISYTDNSAVLAALVGRPVSVLSVIDDESKMPHGSDSSLMGNIKKNLPLIECRDKPDRFIVKHFAGRVEYVVANMIEKNRDVLPELVREVLSSSSFFMVRSFFMSPEESKKFFTRRLVKAFANTYRKKSIDGESRPSAVSPSVSGRFFKSLQELMATLARMDPHFVRCLKPNVSMMARLYDDEAMIRQLHCTGMLETIRIRKEGFPCRLTFAEFVNEFGCIVYPFSSHPPPNRATVDLVLAACLMAGYGMGRTKVFLKDRQLDILRRRLASYPYYASIIQKIYRGFIARKKFRSLLAQKKMEDLIAYTFFKDMLMSGTAACNNLKTINDADLARWDHAQAALHQHKTPLYPQEKVPDFFSKVYQKSLKDNRAQAMKWFQETELPRGALRISESSPVPEDLPATDYDVGDSVSMLGPQPPLPPQDYDMTLAKPSHNPLVKEESNIKVSDVLRRSKKGSHMSVDSSGQGADPFIASFRRRSYRTDEPPSLPGLRGSPRSNGGEFDNNNSSFESFSPVPSRSREPTEDAPWFYGMINRVKAEKLLSTAPSGTFLVRLSENKRGYVLSVILDDRFKHYKIDVTDSLKYVIVGKHNTFPDLHRLIKHYTRFPLSEDDDILKEPLIYDLSADVECQLQNADLLLTTKEAKNFKAATMKKIKTEGKLAQPSSSSSQDFVKALAPIIKENPDSLDAETIVALEGRYGARQALDVPLPQANNRHSITNSEAGAVMNGQIPQPAINRPVPRLVRSPSQELKHLTIIAEAEKRIALARQDWEKKKKLKAKKAKKSKSKEAIKEEKKFREFKESKRFGKSAHGKKGDIRSGPSFVVLGSPPKSSS